MYDFIFIINREENRFTIIIIIIIFEIIYKIFQDEAYYLNFNKKKIKNIKLDQSLGLNNLRRQELSKKMNYLMHILF